MLDKIVKEIIQEVEGKKKTTAVYGGGFRPPTSGHFEVVKQALEQNPEIDELIIFVGAKERDGITQAQSTLIWEIYKRYLPFKVTIIPTKVAPIRAIYDYAKEHPQDEVLWVIGAREGNEEDFKDIASRTKSMDKYPNMELRTIVTANGVSGTAARNALKVDDNKFKSFLPEELSDDEKQDVLDIVVKAPIEDEAEDLNESQDLFNNLLEQDDLLALEVVNPDGETFEIQKSNFKGLYTYEDSMGNLYFARITFEPTKPPFFEFKVGWFEDNDIQKPKYDPLLPPKVTSKDDLKRRNTVAKIYRDEILPFFKQNQKLADKLKVTPISNSRYIFSQRLLKNHTPKEFNIEENPTDIVISLKENLNEQVNIDFKKHIASLTKKMVEDGLTVKPLPKLIFKKDETEAEDFFGKTAYYEPSSQTIVLYVKDRHPKDIVRSFAHEMIHHIQNLEGRLGDISTTNTNEDDALLDLEKEAYLDGNITFRNWTDSLTGNKLAESIVGQKIICDNCGWSWNIADGGDDMFTCHKCGSEDNMPIAEKKNKDQLKELKQNPISKTPKGKLFLVELEKFLNL